MDSYPRLPFDLASYTAATTASARRGDCFICSIVAGSLDGHLVLLRDDVSVAFLAKWPTLVGYALLAPIEHRTGVVGHFSEGEYVEYERQQYAALMHERGYLDIPDADQEALVRTIVRNLDGS